MLSSRIRQLMRLERISIGLTGFLFGLVISVLSNWLYEYGSALLVPIIAATILFALISLGLYLRQQRGIDVAIKAPLTIRSAQEAQRHARRGFVGFVPLYTPKPGTPAARLSKEERAAALEALDFDRLQVEESNLRPTIEAIANHASRLEHCWLLSTDNRDKNAPGSLHYAPLLAEYLRQRKQLTCQFHYGEAYAIPLDDDALVLSKTYDQVRRVFREAAGQESAIASREMVADITTGVRSMTLGMILACLDQDRDIEFIGTHYNVQGQATGDLFPIIFSFEPMLE